MSLHHPGEEWLMDYAYGALPEAASLPIGVHLWHCPLCREDLACLENIGGVLLGASGESNVSSECRNAVMRRLGHEQAEIEVIVAEKPGGCMPEPLRPYFGGAYSRLDQLDALSWSIVEEGLQGYSFEFRTGNAAGWLIRMEKGTTLPYHAFHATDMVVVLSGRLAQTGENDFLPGDLSIGRSGDVGIIPIVAAQPTLYLRTFTQV